LTGVAKEAMTAVVMTTVAMTAVAMTTVAMTDVAMTTVAMTAVTMTTVALKAVAMTTVAMTLSLRASDTLGMGRMQGSATEKVKERRQAGEGRELRRDLGPPLPCIPSVDPGDDVIGDGDGDGLEVKGQGFGSGSGDETDRGAGGSSGDCSLAMVALGHVISDSSCSTNRC
jgi:hypothetical protein